MGGNVMGMLKIMACAVVVFFSPCVMANDATTTGLRAGAAVVNITPPLGETIVGAFHPFAATHIHDELHARCLVIDDGNTTLAFVVCDLLGIHRSVSDGARRCIADELKIPLEHVLIAATHTHSAATALGGAGTERFQPVQNALTSYQAFVVRRIADGVRRASNLLRPAVFAAGAVDIPEHVFNRRWFMRPGAMPENPFGFKDELVKMNPPRGNANLDRPAGPTDPTLSFLVFREPDGELISIFGTYSLHYVGGVPRGHVSADYFGIVCDELERLTHGDQTDPPCVAMLANGTSGDINNINFRERSVKREPYEQMRFVAKDVAAKILEAMKGLHYSKDVPLDVRYAEPLIKARHPTRKELNWANRVKEEPVNQESRKTLSQIYADRVLALEKQPDSFPVPLQVFKIGPVCIGTMPCEVFCEIGLEFRRRSGGDPGFLVSLSHGYLGYLPTPRQHDYGGYETWPGTNRLTRDASETMLSTLLEMCAEVNAPRQNNQPPQDASQFQIDPGLVIDLVAREPDIVDPVAIAFDENGFLWVAEMQDYPTGPADGGRPLSRISVLKDHDGDGYFEHVERFADELSFCNGLQPWLGGVIATCAGRVAWLHDSDGDGRADKDITLFKGFSEQNSQLRANHPVLGRNGKVYVANGLRGGSVVAVDDRWQHTEQQDMNPLEIRGHDFCFDPRGGEYCMVSGHGQFGLTFDDFGTRFICSNRNPCIQVMLEETALSRNPSLVLESVVQDAAPAGTSSRLYPRSKGWTTSNLHAGQFTAACGVTIYRGSGLPRAYNGDAFTCDPTGNLIHRSRLKRQGVTYSSHVNNQKREFLASSDEWFRPVNLTCGPDGYLYVVDMCRAVIEHPDFMPEELKKRPDLRDGDHHGRIWRIRPKGSTSSPQYVIPAKQSVKQLASLLHHSNGWHRDTAMRRLLEAGANKQVRQSVREAVFGSLPAGRSQSLQLLAALDSIDPDVLCRSCIDDHARVRETAVALMGDYCETHETLKQYLLRAARDPDAAVRFRAAISIGQMRESVSQKNGPEIIQALADIVIAAPHDPWTLAAVGTAVSGCAVPVLEDILKRDIHTVPTRLIGYFAELAAASDESLDRLIQQVGALENAQDLWLAFAEGLGGGLGRRRTTVEALSKALSRESRQVLDTIFKEAAHQACQMSLSPSARIRAIDVLGYAGESVGLPVLLGLIEHEENQDVRRELLVILSQWNSPQINSVLVADLHSLTPALQRVALNACCAKVSRAKNLLSMIESGRLAPTLLSEAQWKKLGTLRDASIQEQVQRIRASIRPADRAKVLSEYQVSLSLQGDRERGQRIFLKNCASCHRIGEQGVNVGPDISDSRTQKPSQYLVHILDPNRTIDANYFSYTLIQTDGRVQTGLITSETGQSLTLRQQDGKDAVLTRDEIASVSTTGVSFMPVGFERTINPQQMADLITFLKEWRYVGTTLIPSTLTRKVQP